MPKPVAKTGDSHGLRLRHESVTTLKTGVTPVLTVPPCPAGRRASVISHRVERCEAENLSPRVRVSTGRARTTTAGTTRTAGTAGIAQTSGKRRRRTNRLRAGARTVIGRAPGASTGGRGFESRTVAAYGSGR